MVSLHQDLEDLHIRKCAKKCSRKRSKSDDDWCLIEVDKCEALKELNTVAGRWYKAYSVEDIFKVFCNKDYYRRLILPLLSSSFGLFPEK